MQNSLLKAIKLEYQRDNLAKKGNYKKLVSLYARGIEIPNLNSGKLWDPINKNGILRKKNPMAYNRILAVTSKIHGSRLKILDIGPGQGMLEEIVDTRGICDDLWGVDIARKSTKKLRIKYKWNNWKFIEGNITETDIPTGYFDYVTALEVLEHIEPSKLFLVLEKIHKSLKQGGVFIVSVPLNEGLEQMLKIGMNPNAHTRIYTPDVIMAEMRISGFKVHDKQFLYAFHTHYMIKSALCRIFPLVRKPNNIILISEKT
ncbi:MAG: class I SAM-dependent methyltransferase [bacterium]|nr:class I SAM-dependent methyltransferase [bacterium]